MGPKIPRSVLQDNLIETQRENERLRARIAKLERKISDNNQYMAERNLYILELEAAHREIIDTLAYKVVLSEGVYRMINNVINISRTALMNL